MFELQPYRVKRDPPESHFFIKRRAPSPSVHFRETQAPVLGREDNVPNVPARRVSVEIEGKRWAASQGSWAVGRGEGGDGIQGFTNYQVRVRGRSSD